MINILAIGELQIKTTMKEFLTPTEITIIKNTANNKCRQGCEETGTLRHLLGCKMVQPLLEKKLNSSSKC